MTRRTFLSSAAVAASAANRPNIILCMGDDHGWNETGYYKHPNLRTPVLDQMAASGLRFDNFYSAHPNCSPTRGSIMTGRHPNRYGTFSPGWSTRPEEITIAHIMKKAGYATGHFGKWHLGPVKAASPTSPGAMGFDTWLSHDNFFELDPWFSRNGGPIQQYKGESSEIVVREALSFIDKARQPTFTVIWFGSPHEPYLGQEPYLSLYKDLSEPLRSRLAEISAMDAAIGHLRQHLEKTNRRHNTLLWYCGDNGVPPEGRVNTPYRGAKGQVYDGGVRVPGIIEWPAQIPGPRVTNCNAVTTDILPTLCAVTGQPLPARPLDGISLLPLITGKMKQRPTPVYFWEYAAGNESNRNPDPYIDPELQQGTTPTAKLQNGKYTRAFRNQRHPRIEEADFAGAAAVLTNRFKLVRTKTTELYDLPRDKGESNDIAGANPARVAALEKQLRAWQRSVLTSLTGADYRRR